MHLSFAATTPIVTHLYVRLVDTTHIRCGNVIGHDSVLAVYYINESPVELRPTGVRLAMMGHDSITSEISTYCGDGISDDESTETTRKIHYDRVHCTRVCDTSPM